MTWVVVQVLRLLQGHGKTAKEARDSFQRRLLLRLTDEYVKAFDRAKALERMRDLIQGAPDEVKT